MPNLARSSFATHLSPETGWLYNVNFFHPDASNKAVCIAFSSLKELASKLPTEFRISSSIPTTHAAANTGKPCSSEQPGSSSSNDVSARCTGTGGRGASRGGGCRWQGRREGQQQDHPAGRGEETSSSRVTAATRTRVTHDPMTTTTRKIHHSLCLEA
eukprot:1630815-Pleurochrysis_carterae.AAC.1